MFNVQLHRTYIACLIAILLYMIGFTPCRADYDYINISNPFLKKVPLAVPLFKSFSQDEETSELAQTAADLLSETLEFTAYFKLLDHGAFLENPQESGILLSQINFRNWTGIDAELLITGGVLITNDVAEMELRLFDTFKERMLIGKRYKAQKTDYRRMVRRFCSELIHYLTDSWGYFDSKIAFVSTGSGNKEIHISDFDGYNPGKITNTGSITLSPAWSSDGKWLAYTAYVKGKPDLYIRHLTEKRGAVVAFEGVNITPAWIPGKFALAATLSFSGDLEIYMLTGTGKVIKRLTNNWGIDVSPTFSPDANNMAFVSKRSGTPQIYIKNLNSEKVERLTYQGNYNTTPSWSPAGDKIAYCSLEKGRFNIFVIDIESKTPVQLTYNAGDNEAPTWSPDGSLIAFSSTREGGKSRIYVMTSYGTDQKRLLILPGEQTNPKWSMKVIGN